MEDVWSMYSIAIWSIFGRLVYFITIRSVL
jgi:hypothetical protein